MANKKIAIIGAGVTGLCAGCYLQMNGYDTEIFELHNLPGGLCTSWKRGGYTFDGCIHWLCHTSPRGSLYGMWNELIDMSALDVVDFDYFARIERAGGESVTIYTDADRLEEELLSVAPRDKKAIRELKRGILNAARVNSSMQKAPELMGPADLLKSLPDFLPMIPLGMKWGSIDHEQLAAKFSSPLLRYALPRIMDEKIAAIALVFTLADLHKRAAGYPVGGSLAFARLIEKRYLELGGSVSYNSRVEKIVTRNGAARGVELDSGEQRDAGAVLSCADGCYTVYKMLGGRYTSRKIDRMYSLKNKAFVPFPSLVQVSLGVARTFEDEPHMLLRELAEPIRLDPETVVKNLETRIYSFDPTLSPQGKTCVISLMHTCNHDYWDGLKRNDPEKYSAVKQRIAGAVIDAQEERFGDIKDNVEVVDVATPSTYMRYTNNWRGSFEGWLPVPGAMSAENYRMKKTLPGLKNFYMTGQWMMPGGGLPQCLMGGRNITQVICHDDGRSFTHRA